MSPFPNFDLVAAPGIDAALSRLPATDLPQAELLLLYGSDYDFLERVLNAAGYDDPAAQVYALEWTAEDGPLNLTALLRRLDLKRVMLFGQDLTALGLHLQVADYFPVTVAGVTYLRCPPAGEIAAAKARGDNGPAGALWRAVKLAYLRE